MRKVPMGGCMLEKTVYTLLIEALEDGAGSEGNPGERDDNFIYNGIETDIGQDNLIHAGIETYIGQDNLLYIDPRDPRDPKIKEEEPGWDD